VKRGFGRWGVHQFQTVLAGSHISREPLVPVSVLLLKFERTTCSGSRILKKLIERWVQFHTQFFTIQKLEY
jgi:hypothetical protein